MATDQSALDLETAVLLGYAIVDRVAKDLGVRCLAIKGPTLGLHRLRAPRQSVDIDVLVDPREVESLVTGLAGLGWAPVPAGHEVSLFAPHSTTYGHAKWPCTIDLHHDFPGFLAGAETAFEALWGDRASVSIASQDVTATGVAGATLIMVLHSLRQGSFDEVRSELALALGRWRSSAATEAERMALLSLAEETGADRIALGFLRDIGLEPSATPRHGTDEDVSEWRIRNRLSGVHGTGWVLRFSRTAPWRWPLILWRELWPSDAVLAGHGLKSDKTNRSEARRSRFRRLMTDLPSALGVMWQERRVIRSMESRRARRGPDVV